MVGSARIYRIYQEVSVNDFYSESLTNTHSVPQGSNLGPLLFFYILMICRVLPIISDVLCSLTIVPCQSVSRKVSQLLCVI